MVKRKPRPNRAKKDISQGEGADAQVDEMARSPSRVAVKQDDAGPSQRRSPRLAKQRSCSTKSEDANHVEEGSNGGHLPYIEVQLPDGRTMRKCVAGYKCANGNLLIEKRQRMVDHLRLKHGLTVEIPLRQIGRRRGSRSSSQNPNPNAKAWRKLSLKRSVDEEYKWKVNCKNYEARQVLQAREAWDDLRPEFKSMDKEAHIEQMTKPQIEKYMATAEARKERIRRGVQARQERVKNELASSVDVEDKGHPQDQPGDESHLQGNMGDEEMQSVDAQHPRVDKGKLPMEESDQHKDQIDFDMGLQSDEPSPQSSHVVAVRKRKIPIRSSRRRQVKGGEKNEEVVDVESTDVAKTGVGVSLTFEISIDHVKVKQIGELPIMPTSGELGVSRLYSGAQMSFVSKRSGLICNVNSSMLGALVSDKASTETMTLFSIWMESTLPSDTLSQVVFVDSMWYTMQARLQTSFLQKYFQSFDVSRLAICFFPIICRGHWTLVVLYLNGNQKVRTLRGQKGQLLFFDSLAITDAMECLESVHRACKLLAPFMADPMSGCRLSNPAEELELCIVDVPTQPNGTDCGFYVMACMKHLSKGLKMSVKNIVNAKEWLFHEDVCLLKMDLQYWALECLRTV